MDYSGSLTFNLLPSTGQCISRFTNRKVPYCVKFNPDEEKQNLFVAGMSDKKIVQVKLAFAALRPIHNRVYFPVDQAGAHMNFCVYPCAHSSMKYTPASSSGASVCSRVYVASGSVADRTRASH